MRSRTRIPIVVAVVALACPAAGSADASAAPIGRALSANWAGYFVSGRQFKRVAASWRQPSIHCSAGQPASMAVWVGLGGAGGRSSALEQAGTEADCDSSGAVSYNAWFELLPASASWARLPVAAGDSLSVTVTVGGGRTHFRLVNHTRRRTFTRTLASARVDRSSADWIVEAPTGCGDGGCQLLRLANFGTASFRGATATPARGRPGAIADRRWHATNVRLAAVGAQGAASEAVAGGLAGRGFSVAYRPASGVEAQRKAPLYPAKH